MSAGRRLTPAQSILLDQVAHRYRALDAPVLGEAVGSAWTLYHLVDKGWLTAEEYGAADGWTAAPAARLRDCSTYHLLRRVRYTPTGDALDRSA